MASFGTLPMFLGEDHVSDWTCIDTVTNKVAPNDISCSSSKLVDACRVCEVAVLQPLMTRREVLDGRTIIRRIACRSWLRSL